MISRSKGFMMYSLAPAVMARVMCSTSFSVVQKITLGRLPSRSLRSATRKATPYMSRMFQSSSTASGIDMRHLSSASRPFSASEAVNFISSRMRRATLRMTALSSTTKQCFIAFLPLLFRRRRPSRSAVSVEIEHLVDIEPDNRALLEPMHTSAELGPARIEIDRIGLVAGALESEHVAHRIDDETVKFPAVLDADSDRRPAVFPGREAQRAA